MRPDGEGVTRQSAKLLYEGSSPSQASMNSEDINQESNDGAMSSATRDRESVPNPRSATARREVRASPSQASKHFPISFKLLYTDAMKTKQVPALILTFSILISFPWISFAGHKSFVGAVIIDSTDTGIYEEHEGRCAYRHYHGELDGVADPAPNGCGHGEVKSIVHGDGDGESLPPPPVKSNWSQFTTWLGSWFTKENVINVIDVAAEANGIPPPGAVSDAVDIVKEATPQIMEKVEGIKEYRESVSPEEDTLDLYNDLSDVPENPTLSQRFFKWFLIV